MSVDEDRRALLAALGCGALGSVLVAGPAGADTALDVRILQTASSLEALAVAFYSAAGDDALAGFVGETRRRHEEHKEAFQARMAGVDPDARIQDAPNPAFAPRFTGADIATPERLVDLATQLETVITGTYLSNLPVLQDRAATALMASVLGVSAQHLATLRTFGALLRAGAPDLVVVPLPLDRLMDVPRAAGSAAFPEAFHRVGGADRVADPTSGAAS
ncbi:MAG: ferritin-like domain-containing protein [Acidimicrobiales bacterium]